MKEDLLAELKEEATFCTVWARRNYRYAHIVFGVSVLSSFLTTVLVAGDVWTQLFGPITYKVVTTTLAAVPAVMLLVNNTIRFEERTKWFWRKGRMVQRFLRALRDDPTANPALVSREFSIASEELEDDWPTFGSTPEQAVKVVRLPGQSQLPVQNQPPVPGQQPIQNQPNQ